MDPTEVSRGTGTPVENGLSLNNTTELLVKLVENKIGAANFNLFL